MKASEPADIEDDPLAGIEMLLAPNLSKSEQGLAIKAVSNCLVKYYCSMKEPPPGQIRQSVEMKFGPKGEPQFLDEPCYQDVDGAAYRRMFARAADVVVEAFDPQLFYGQGEEALKKYEQAIETLDEMAMIAEGDAEEWAKSEKWETRGRATDPRLLDLVADLAKVWESFGGAVRGHANNKTGGPLIAFLKGITAKVLDQEPSAHVVLHWVRRIQK